MWVCCVSFRNQRPSSHNKLRDSLNRVTIFPFSTPGWLKPTRFSARIIQKLRLLIINYRTQSINEPNNRYRNKQACQCTWSQYVYWYCVCVPIAEWILGAECKYKLVIRIKFRKKKCFADVSELWFESYSLLLLSCYPYVNSLKKIWTIWETNPRTTHQKTSRLLMVPGRATRPKILQAKIWWWIKETLRYILFATLTVPHDVRLQEYKRSFNFLKTQKWNKFEADFLKGIKWIIEDLRKEGFYDLFRLNCVLRRM